MYEHILWSKEPFCNILEPCPELYERSIVLNGVSKVYAMTGWRIGYAGGPADLIKAMKKIQSQSTSNPTSISQVAAQAALEGDQSCIQPMIKAFRERHDFVVAALNRIPDITCLPADGTFYCFPHVQPVIDRLDGVGNDVELAEYLLDRTGVALVPGSAFGTPGYLRLSFATGLDTLKEALDRLATALTA
jgi:aspartate aminotransferase